MIVAECALPLVNKLKVNLNSPLTLKSRENMLEMILLNHPLNCPICDQGSECDLQNLSYKEGSSESRFFYNKNSKNQINLNLKTKTSFIKFISCTKCVRLD